MAFRKEPPPIGKYIQQLVKSKGLKREDVAKALHCTIGNLDKMYLRTSLSKEQLDILSVFLETDLYAYLQDQAPLKGKFSETEKLKQEIASLKKSLAEKNEFIAYLKKQLQEQKKINRKLSSSPSSKKRRK